MQDLQPRSGNWLNLLQSRGANKKFTALSAKIMELRSIAATRADPLEHLEVSGGIAERRDWATANVRVDADGFAPLNWVFQIPPWRDYTRTA
jgi:hypothetical protein